MNDIRPRNAGSPFDDRVAERGSLPSPWRRVRIDGLDVRVRDLVWLTFGQTGDYESRVNAEMVESGWFQRFEDGAA